jgi:hypothetical protein
MTTTATMAKATRSQAKSFSRCRSHPSSGVIVSLWEGVAGDIVLKIESVNGLDRFYSNWVC